MLGSSQTIGAASNREQTFSLTTLERGVAASANDRGPATGFQAEHCPFAGVFPTKMRLQAADGRTVSRRPPFRNRAPPTMAMEGKLCARRELFAFYGHSGVS